MSNKEILTEKEFARYEPSKRLMQRIELCRERLDLERDAFTIVDWGCGRGRFVLWLLEHGYRAFGVDVDARPFANGSELFRRKGRAAEATLFTLDEKGRAPFSDGAVEFVTSYQTLEHIADLEQAVEEMRRITAPRGEGFHVFPPHLRLVEPHLFMPLVHWLPKNRLRKASIEAALRMGFDPKWWPGRNIPRATQVDTYYTFSVEETFYRRPSDIVACFAAHGWDARFSIVHDSRRPRVLQGSSWLVAWWHRHFAGDIGLITSAWSM